MITILVIFIVAVIGLVFLTKFLLDSNQKNLFEKSASSNNNALLKKFEHADLNRWAKPFATMGLMFSLAFVLWAFEHRTYDDSGILDLGQVEDDFEDIMDIPPTEQPPPPPTKSSNPGNH